jgi:hypothetical protein
LHPNDPWLRSAIISGQFILVATSATLPGSDATAQALNIGDCDSAAFVCADTLIQGAAFSVGAVNDLLENYGCMYGGERSSAWVEFAIATSGTLGFMLTPDNNFTDLDFAVWGPYSAFQCPLPTDPVRCSFASRLSQASSSVGLVLNVLDTSEVANNGDGLLATLAVNAGELYVLYINNFSMSGDAVAISWNLAQGATLSCSRPISTDIVSQPATMPILVRLQGTVINVAVDHGEFEAYLADALGRQVMQLRAQQAGAFDVTSVHPGRYSVTVLTKGNSLMRTYSMVIPPF